MKTKQLTYLTLAFLFGVGRAIADDRTATVKEVVNDVSYGSTLSAVAFSAFNGLQLRDQEYLKTGRESRAELLLPSTSLARLGANTIFNFSLAENEVDLKQGTILFCKPKDAAQQLHIKTAAVTAAIVGTTGFTSVHKNAKTGEKVYVFGLVEGHANVEVDGTTYPVRGGEVLEFSPGKKPVIFAFDIPRLVHSSRFFTQFKGDLPNQKYIDEALADYEDDLKRGFIQPPTHGIDYSGDAPLLLPTAFDSAQSSRNAPPERASTPPSSPYNYGGGR